MSESRVRNKIFIIHTDGQTMPSKKWRFENNSTNPVSLDDFLSRLQAATSMKYVDMLEIYDDDAGHYITLTEELLQSAVSVLQPKHLLVHVLHSESQSIINLIAGRLFDISSGLPMGLGKVRVHEMSAAFLGTGLVCWDGSIVLAKYLEHNPSITMKKSILELGAGTGIGGLAAALLGAEEVMLTDLPYALTNLQHNVEYNIQINVPLLNSSKIKVSKVDWYDASSYPVDCSFDLILGADIVWLEELISPLVNTLKACASSSAMILIAHQTRTMRTDKALFGALSAAGFHYQQVSLTIPYRRRHNICFTVGT